MFTRKRNRVKVVPFGATLTEQHWKKHQDVNNIVARCLRGDYSGLKKFGVNTDISAAPSSLQEYLNQRISAEQAFDALPEVVKAKFPTPADMVRACGDESSRADFEKLGLLAPVVKDEPVKVEIVGGTGAPPAV